jgi:hypothetical protein
LFKAVLGYGFGGCFSSRGVVLRAIRFVVVVSVMLSTSTRVMTGPARKRGPIGSEIVPSGGFIFWTLPETRSKSPDVLRWYSVTISKHGRLFGMR